LGRPNEREHFEGLGVDWRIIIKYKNREFGGGLDSPGLVQVMNPWVLRKAGVFLNY
jgi:hypothetical protein